MCFELSLELFLREGTIFDFGPLRLGLGDGTWVETKFYFLTTLVISHVRRGDTLHPEDLDFIAISPRQGVLNTREACIQWLGRFQAHTSGLDSLFGLELVHLLYVYCQPACGVQSPRTQVALEVLSLLVLHQNLGELSMHRYGLKGMTNPSHLQTPSHSTSTKGGGSARA